MSGADIWRIPASQVRRGGGGSVIQDNGMLSSAMPSSSRNGWLFSEVGAGVKPLALIGTYRELTGWCLDHSGMRIVNIINDLPDIYMGMCYYIPGNRYKGLFPMQDAIADVTSGVLGVAGGMVPGGAGVGSAVASGGGAVSDSVGLFRSIFGKRKKKKPKMSPSTHEIYVKFSYLKQKNMSKIGTGEVSIDDIRDLITAGVQRM